jgi:hypothetical protein
MKMSNILEVDEVKQEGNLLEIPGKQTVRTVMAHSLPCSPALCQRFWCHNFSCDDPRDVRDRDLREI